MNNCNNTKKLLVLTSGGDSPGMNAAIRAVTRSGFYHNFETYGCHGGFQGLVDQKIFPMKSEDVANCIQRGGTILHSSRCTSFYQKATRDICREFLKAKGIEYLVTIGGDGTFRGATSLAKEGGLKIIGIPGTIDNDIEGTDYTIGYDTARNNALQAIDKIRDTATSNSLYFLIETMGRNSGFLAVDVGLAGGAEYILTPEFPIPTAELAKSIMEPRRKKQSLIMVVAEADQPGRSFAIANELRKITSFEFRVCVLGHIQRGGSPTLLDRIAASLMGNLAVEALVANKSCYMTAYKNGQYLLAPFPDPKKSSRRLSDSFLLNLTSILAG